MPVSSNTVFHFTDSPDNLFSILKNEFEPHFSIEKIWLGNKEIEFAVPMVSFCDIPLSQVKQHIEFYGKYGIGLSNSWAIEYGLNPVLYIEAESRIADSLGNLYFQLKELQAESETKNTYLNIIRYLKPYEGEFVRRGNTYDDYRFYNEREWRYVPLKGKSVITKDFLSNKSFIDSENLKMKKNKLSFEPDDIKYIIIENESEINEMIKKIRDLKGEKFSMSQVERLITRIITTEQILKDF